PFAVVAATPGVAQAAPCSGPGSNPTACQSCLLYTQLYHTSNVCDKAATPRPVEAPPSRVPSPIPEVPLEPTPPIYVPPSTVPVQTPEFVPPSPAPPSTVAVQTPKINPQAPTNASVVAPPKELDAPPPAIAAAKAARATRINPASPLVPPMQVYDFN